MPRRVLTAPVIRSLPGRRHGRRRADIVLQGVEQGGPSFETRVFLDNPSADEKTERTLANGYVGSVYVYGYGAAAPPSPGAGAPTTRRVIVTERPGAEPLLTRLEKVDEMAVTVVAASLPQSRESVDVDLTPITATISVGGAGSDAARG